MDRLTIVPEFRWMRHRRKSFARVPMLVLGQTWPTLAFTATSRRLAIFSAAATSPPASERLVEVER
jgi:hypothetical protein